MKKDKTGDAPNRQKRYKTYWDVYKPTTSTGIFGPTYRVLYGVYKGIVRMVRR